jgi:CBS domain containing-hemolysin-like protein
MELLAITFFLLASGFFSGIEIAFISVSKLKVELERQKGGKRGELLAQLVDRPSEFLGTTLVGNNIVLVILSMLAGSYIESRLLTPYLQLSGESTSGILVSTIITTIVVLIFGEFIPKVFFRINPTAILHLFTYPLHFIKFILTPVVWVMVQTSNALIEKILKISTEDDEHVFSRVDLDHFISNITEEGEEEIDKTLFQNALYIHTVKVRDCMIPRNEIQAIEITEDINTLHDFFINTSLSRILVYNESIDFIEGYVHHQSLFSNPETIKEILWSIPMVHEFTPAQEVMNMLIKQNLNLAWVVDERGGTAGIVALEDILEEIFGEIADEHDTKETFIRVSDNEFIFSGREEIVHINQEHGFNIPENEDYHTLSGLLVTLYQNIPEEGVSIMKGNYKFTVEESSSTKIEKVRMYYIPDKEMDV